VILVVVVGALIAASMSTILAGTQEEPARFAQMSVGTHTLDVWREVKTHDLTFRWDETPTTLWRYAPTGSTLTMLTDGRVVSKTRYPSSDAAWQAIRGKLGVTWKSVRAALLQGSPSPLPSTSG
jgi:hypothetical protein